ncbi:hypothetical protein KP803_19105 [Vibrio sp. ZSDE26]|uniref:Uncharacterized protein n=1 Tax=Vibrio amylolyticus TaxID=2847292 RepID=A0A9X1XM82_9VIBR|nr:hypothetical protein [Vibrio amylolyticus]MCK6265379.1 hypothetical protein [Vibrio amylolyticus]
MDNSSIDSTSFHSASLYDFSRSSLNAIISKHQVDASFKLKEKVELIQSQLNELLHLAGDIIFDYPIPHNESKSNVIFLYRGLVFVVIFKFNENEYHQKDIDVTQQLAFALKTHHSLCQDRFIVPVLIATGAESQGCDIQVSTERVINTIVDNGHNLAALLEHFSNQFKADKIDADAWISENN